MAKPYLLVGDIGGANARFAIADKNGPGFSREKIVSCADFETAGQAIRSYLSDVAGGIVPRYTNLLQTSRFRHGFERKGRQQELLEKITTRLVMYPQPGLLGTSFCGFEMFAK
jgi:glucokinase